MFSQQIFFYRIVFLSIFFMIYGLMASGATSVGAAKRPPYASYVNQLVNYGTVRKLIIIYV